MKRAAEYFALFLTELRRDGEAVTLSDADTAALISEALSLDVFICTSSPEEENTANAISQALHYINGADLLSVDNGVNE